MMFAALAAAWVLTPDGYGPAHMGMTKAQVALALAVPLVRTPNEECVVTRSLKRPGMFFMFERGKLTRITVRVPSKVATPRGIHVGSAIAGVKAAYPGIRVGLHEYSEQGSAARSLLYWTKAGSRGVRFLTDEKGRVEEIHAGTKSIEYIEGCS